MALITQSLKIFFALCLHSWTNMICQLQSLQVKKLWSAGVFCITSPPPPKKNIQTLIKVQSYLQLWKRKFCNYFLNMFKCRAIMSSHGKLVRQLWQKMNRTLPYLEALNVSKVYLLSCHNLGPELLRHNR